MAAAVLSDFNPGRQGHSPGQLRHVPLFRGEVTTVSRAILVLGVDAISHLTLGVQLLDYFSGVAINRPQASRAKAELLSTKLPE